MANSNLKVCRIYQRVSTNEQDLSRQDSLITNAKQNGWYVAGVYREKESGARADRPELLRLIADLQENECLIAESMDRISRLPIAEADLLVQSIYSKGARLVVPGLVDLSQLQNETSGVTKIVIDALQDLLLKIALQSAHDDYTQRRVKQRQGIELAKKKGKYRGRPENTHRNNLIREMRGKKSIAETAKLAQCSVSTVKRVWAKKLALEQAKFPIDN